MASPVDICNLALGRLGIDENIENLTEANRDARMCNKFFDRCLRSVLRDHPWNFAVKNSNLAVVSGEEHTEWEYVYGYPSDCLKALKIVNDDSSTDIKYVIALDSTGTRRVILTNQETAELSYIAYITDTNLYDDQFIDALSWRMAKELAQPLVGNNGLTQYCDQQYAIHMSVCKMHNATENQQEPRVTSTFVDAR